MVWFYCYTCSWLLQDTEWDHESFDILQIFIGWSPYKNLIVEIMNLRPLRGLTLPSTPRNNEVATSLPSWVLEMKTVDCVNSTSYVNFITTYLVHHTRKFGKRRTWPFLLNVTWEDTQSEGAMQSTFWRCPCPLFSMPTAQASFLQDSQVATQSSSMEKPLPLPQIELSL